MDFEFDTLGEPPRVRRPRTRLRQDAELSALTHFNRQLLNDLTNTLERNPIANLLEHIPKDYRDYWAKQREQIPETPLSKMGKLNKEYLNDFTHTFRRNPDCNLLPQSMVNYYTKRSSAIRSTMDTPKAPRTRISPPADLRGKLEKVTSGANVIHPLSPAVSNLLGLSQNTPNPNAEVFPKAQSSPDTTPVLSLTQALNKMLRRVEEVIYKSPSRLVLKCNDDIAVKIVGNRDKNDVSEYTALQYLEANAPKIPCPRPYSLVAIDRYQIIFMSYIPSQPLQQVWPNLTKENKAFIRDDLGQIFGTLRKIRRPDNGQYPLGSIDQQHLVKDHLQFHSESDRPLFSAAEFEEWKWFFASHIDPSYGQFIRGFLNEPRRSCDGQFNFHSEEQSSSPSSTPPLVFTHGDVGPHNILVKEIEHSEGSGKTFGICGIVDWEYSGFYPESCESQRISTLSTDNGDWALWVPECISPWTWPVEWFVERHLELLLTVLGGHYLKKDRESAKLGQEDKKHREV